jgi:hypothetical protein
LPIHLLAPTHAHRTAGKTMWKSPGGGSYLWNGTEQAMGFSDDQLMAREAPDLRLPMQGLSDEDLLRREGLAPPRAEPEPPHVDTAGDAMHRYQEASHFKEGEETPVSRTLRAGQEQMNVPDSGYMNRRSMLGRRWRPKAPAR